MTIDEANIVVPKNITLLGAKAGTDVVSAGRAVEADPADETIIVQPVTLNDGARLDGVTLKSRPIIGDVKEVTIENSRLVNITVSPTGDNLQKAVIGMNQWNTPAKINIDGNYFGKGTNVYNVFELNVPLKNGSSISNNYFNVDAGSHNVINIYAVDDNSNITIEGNHFDKAANGIRLGPKGTPNNVNVMISNNDYNATDSGAYAGLLLIQPYVTATIDMSGVRVDLNNTINNSGEPQLWYYYAGAGDAQLTNAEKPKVYINGNLQPYTI